MWGIDLLIFVYIVRNHLRKIVLIFHLCVANSVTMLGAGAFVKYATAGYADIRKTWELELGQKNWGVDLLGIKRIVKEWKDVRAYLCRLYNVWPRGATISAYTFPRWGSYNNLKQYRFRLPHMSIVGLSHYYLKIILRGNLHWTILMVKCQWTECGRK